MSPVEIRDHLRQTPFKPFRLCMSDGSSYDVPHRDWVFVSRTTVAVALRLGEDDLADRMVYLDPLHITRIEPLESAPTRGTGENGRS
jgi:hypothetical protein